MATIKYKIEKAPKTWLDDVVHSGVPLNQYTVQGCKNNSISFRPSRYSNFVYLLDTKTSERLSLEKIISLYPDVYELIIKNIDKFTFEVELSSSINQIDKFTFKVELLRTMVINFDDFVSYILPQMAEEV